MDAIFEDLALIRTGKAAVIEYTYPSLSDTIEFLRENCQYELKGRQCLRVLEGLVLGLFNIGNLGAKAAASVKESMSTGMIQRDWKDVWGHGLSEINLEFYEDIGNIISSALDFKHIQELRWVLKSHLFSHVLGKHLVECPETTALLEELKAEEDSGSGMVSAKSAKPSPSKTEPVKIEVKQTEEELKSTQK